MLQCIWIYQSADGALAYHQSGPVAAAVLVHCRGLHQAEDGRIAIPRVGPTGFSPEGLLLAARRRLFRLRVWLDRTGRRGSRRGRPRARAEGGAA